MLMKHLNGLPEGLAAHVKRVQIIARDLAKVHGVDPDIAELTAAAHDVARHINPKRLLEEAEKLGLKITSSVLAKLQISSLLFPLPLLVQLAEPPISELGDRKETFHPVAIDTRNSIILATYC